MANKVFNIIIKLSKQGGADKDTVRALTDIKTAMTQGAAVAGLFVGAYYAIDKALDATVGKLMSSASGVKSFSDALSLSYTQGSRMIQVLDDYAISAKDVETALFQARKNGIDVTVEGLAQMADQYNALADPQEKANFLQENFGKSGKALASVLASGSAEILRRNAGVNELLILDAQVIRQTEEYRLALDSVSDSAAGFQLASGQFILPTLQLIVKWVNNALGGWTEFIKYFLLSDPSRNLVTMTERVGLLEAEIARLETAPGDNGRRIANLNEQLVATHAQITLIESGDLPGIFGEASNAAEELAAQTERNVEIGKEYERLISGTVPSIEEMIVAAYQWQLAQDGMFSADDAQEIAAYKHEIGLLTDAEYAATLRAIGLKTAIDLLKDKHITITVDFLSGIQPGGEGWANVTDITGSTAPAVGSGQWVLAGTVSGPGSPPVWENITTGEMTTTDMTGHALGGVFVSDLARVGERGEEWLVRNQQGDVVVLPNDMIRRLQQWGIPPGMGFVSGGILFDAGGGSATGTQHTPSSPYAYHGPLLPNNTPSIPDYGGPAGNQYLEAYYKANDMWTGGGSGAVIQQSVEAATQSAVEAVAPVVTQAVQTFQASNQQNAQQVSRQTLEAARSNAAQLAELKHIANLLEDQASQLAAEIQKRRQ